MPETLSFLDHHIIKDRVMADQPGTDSGPPRPREMAASLADIARRGRRLATALPARHAAPGPLAMVPRIDSGLPPGVAGPLEAIEDAPGSYVRTRADRGTSS